MLTMRLTDRHLHTEHHDSICLCLAGSTALTGVRTPSRCMTMPKRTADCLPHEYSRCLTASAQAAAGELWQMLEAEQIRASLTPFGKMSRDGERL